MTTPATHSRLVKLRSSEHRRAQASLAKAQADLTRLGELSERLEQLRQTMAHGPGETAAYNLKMTSSMADRLDHARAALVEPLLAATAHRDEREAESRRAGARADVAERLFAQAERAAEIAQELRRDAARIVRTPTTRLRLIEGGMP